VKGLVARGGFVVDIQWGNGQLRYAKIVSRIGGTLRLRSYIPLKGKGLQIAQGACPNPLLTSANIKTPLISENLPYSQMPLLYQVYEYDVNTHAGETVEVAPL